jgi:hypothetical protein
MSAAYQHLALSEVKPGMILSDELLGQQGQVLLPKGAVLTANTIALLPAHGIEMLAILRADGAAAAPPDQDAILRRQARLFRKNAMPDDEAFATSILQRYILDFRLGKEIAP